MLSGGWLRQLAMQMECSEYLICCIPAQLAEDLTGF